MGPDLAAIGPQQRLEAVCRTAAGCANHLGYFGRSDRSAQECNSTVGPISEKTMVFLECKEAFENMCPVNEQAQPPGPRAGQYTTKDPNAARVGRSDLFGQLCLHHEINQGIIEMKMAYLSPG
jgi:hypothetical protein